MYHNKNLFFNSKSIGTIFSKIETIVKNQNTLSKLGTSHKAGQFSAFTHSVTRL